MEALNTKEIQRLRKLHHSQRNRRQADKIKAIILLGTGWTVAKVAEALLLDEKTIHRYQHAYRHDAPAPHIPPLIRRLMERV